jgi:DNA replication and repair protein RecF
LSGGAPLTESSADPATYLAQLWLTDFRCFAAADVALAPGLTVLDGANGQGKTSLLEAVGWIARRGSFRGVPDALLVRAGTEQAFVRAEIVNGARTLRFEAEIRASGRNRVRCNGQAVARARDLHGLLRVTVFAPDDLALVKAGPSERRTYLDELLVMLSVRYDAARGDYERVLRQRNALLRAGVRDMSARETLAVFDEQLIRSGSELIRGRLRLIERLAPLVDASYAALAPAPAPVTVAYDAEWADGRLDATTPDEVEPCLRDAIERREHAEIDRGMTLVGPHRDELRLTLASLDARAQASQGEQRTLALALRLAGHAVVTDVTGTAPVLLLDDVFSELDAQRAAALVENLPGGQTLLTSAGVLPPSIVAEQHLHVNAGTIFGAAG